MTRKIRVKKNRRANQILACRDIYLMTDVAKHFNVKPELVKEIWKSKKIPPVEPPNIKTTEIDEEILLIDTKILVERGLSYRQIAQNFGIGRDEMLKFFRKHNLDRYPPWIDRRRHH